MGAILRDAAARATRYLEQLERRRVAPSPDAVNRLPELGGPLPDQPMDPEGVLAALDTIGSPATVASAGGRYFGFVIGGSLPAALAANWLAGAWDQNAGLWVSSPTSAALEEIAVRWLIDALRLPEQSDGALVTGTTMANFSALAAARHEILARAGWDVEGDGLFGAPPITVIVGEEVHVSVLKALSMLGLGRDRVVRIPTDAQGRMRPDALPALTDRTIICAQAGNVNTGALDPIGEICAVAHDASAWVHVDGAFGLWAAASPALVHLVRGTEDADSWAVDAHKWLNTPYDGGAVFVRDAADLTAAMSASAAYLPQDGRRDPMRYTPEVSRRARGVEIWAALRSLGRAGLADLIDRTCRYARRFADGLARAGYPPLNEVVLNQVLISFGDDGTTRRVIEGIQADGTCWCGGTVWHGRAAMRISVSSWATTEQDIDRSLAAVLHIAAKTKPA
ncbi:MAG TPA: aminotransferase class V-fold PLP-dependent enzyme [bacterium]|nr:aminotransferase class V-fold PLP-dependent enzyme [bacterium]